MLRSMTTTIITTGYRFFIIRSTLIHLEVPRSGTFLPQFQLSSLKFDAIFKSVCTLTLELESSGENFRGYINGERQWKDLVQI
jgi:hypothetical protein